MRSIPMYVCALLLAACSGENTTQSSSAIAQGAEASQAGRTGVGAADAGAQTFATGCTYTQGFWKNHLSQWPVATLTIGGVSYDQKQLVELFDTPPGGDASLILGHQLIAALLNVANGAAPSATVQQAIDSAQTWMAANLGRNSGLPYGVASSSAAGPQATALSETLDGFNSGTAGTPHCGDGTGSGGSASSSGGSGPGTSGGACVGEGCIDASGCVGESCGSATAGGGAAGSASGGSITSTPR